MGGHQYFYGLWIIVAGKKQLIKRTNKTGYGAFWWFLFLRLTCIMSIYLVYIYLFYIFFISNNCNFVPHVQNNVQLWIYVAQLLFY